MNIMMKEQTNLLEKNIKDRSQNEYYNFITNKRPALVFDNQTEVEFLLTALELYKQGHILEKYKTRADYYQEKLTW